MTSALEIALRRYKALPFAILFALAFLAYYPALGGSFVWDDEYLVSNSPLIKSPVFLFEVFRHYLYPFSTSAYYRPFQNVSYIIDYWFWNKNPFGYHLTNLLLHAGSACLLFQLLLKRLPALRLMNASSRALACAIAALWVVHPVHNAVAAYIAGRADSLAASCALAGWLIYLKALESPSVGQRALRYGAALLVGFLALCSKEIAFVWVGVFVLVEVVFSRTLRWQRKLRVGIGLLCLSLAYAFIHHGLGARAVAAPECSMAERVSLAFRALGEYVSLLIFPTSLHMERTLTGPSSYFSAGDWANSWSFEYLPLIGACGLFALVYFSMSGSPHRRLFQLGAAWFAVGFIPISNLFPLGAESAEHWIYIPSIGLFLAVAAVVLNTSEHFRHSAWFAVVAIVVLFTIRTNLRSRDWVDEKTLYSQTIEAGGVSVRSLVNLARVQAKSGDESAAGALLERAVKDYPTDYTARVHLGLHYLRIGDQSAASKYFATSTEAPSQSNAGTAFWTGTLKVAQLTFERGESEKAIAMLEDSSRANPDVWLLVKLKADFVEKSRGASASVSIVRDYVAGHWWNYEAVQQLALLDAEAGDFEKSLTSFESASRLDVHASEPFDVPAHFAFERGLWTRAESLESQAIRRDPNRATQYLFLSRILERLERPEESKAAVAKAQSLSQFARVAGL